MDTWWLRTEGEDLTVHDICMTFDDTPLGWALPRFMLALDPDYDRSPGSYCRRRLKTDPVSTGGRNHL